MERKPLSDTHPPDNARTALLDAAESLMTERGFDGTSVQAIADRAAANKALVFYYFGNKSALFEQVLERYLAGLHQALTATAAQGTDTPGAALHRMLDAYIVYIEANPSYPRLVQRELANTQGRHDLLARYNDENFALAKKLLEPLTGPRNSRRAAHQLFTSFVGMVLYYYLAAPLLAPMLGDPWSTRAKKQRRDHVHWMADGVLAQLEAC